MKVKYPLDSTLRKQLADTLKYLRKSKLKVQRSKVEVHEANIPTEGFSDLSLQELLEGITPEDYSSVFIRAGSAEDYDGYGYKEGYIELYSFRNQTDEEYFEQVCSVVEPSPWQRKQYEDYLRLKSMFENQFSTKENTNETL